MPRDPFIENAVDADFMKTSPSKLQFRKEYVPIMFSCDARREDGER
jgi:hypothetical protein